MTIRSVSDCRSPACGKKKPPSLQAVENLLALLFYDIIRLGKWGKHPVAIQSLWHLIVLDTKCGVLDKATFPVTAVR